MATTTTPCTRCHVAPAWTCVLISLGDDDAYDDGTPTDQVMRLCKDCTAWYEGTTLQFSRWIGCDLFDRDRARLEVS
jgi:hypothetical protein